MWGYGGNFVAMLPNGLTAMIFSDVFAFDVPGMAYAAGNARPFPCD